MIRPILGQLQPKQLGQDREEEASADASVKVNLAGNRSERGAAVRPCRPRVGPTMAKHSHVGHTQIYAAETKIGCEFAVCVAILVSQRRSQKDGNRFSLLVVLLERSPQPAI